ncbi:MAG: electron transfer flavoprotein subunit alpha/FixB family protein [Anaerolineae bacterium]
MDFSYLDDWTEEEAAPAIEEVGEGYRNIWVFVETTDAGLPATTLEAMGQARDMADQIGVYVYGVLLGEGIESLGQKLIAVGADKALVAEHPNLAAYQPETYTHALACLVEQYRPEILLLPATPLGNDLAPRLAHRLNTGLISHCTRLSLDMSERLLLGTFAVLDGEMYHTVACPEARPQIATLQPGHFRIPYEDSHRSGDVQAVDVDLADVEGRLTWGTLGAGFDLPPQPLAKAKVVVSAGRGMADAEGFALVEQLAKALGGVAEEQVVGVAGQSIAPDLYVACGVSGDVYHYFGLQEAKFIVAINPDENAPISTLANMALVGDAKQVIPAMLAALAG